MKHSNSIISKDNGKKIESEEEKFDLSVGDGEGTDKPQPGLQKNSHGDYEGQKTLLLERDSRSCGVKWKERSVWLKH